MSAEAARSVVRSLMATAAAAILGFGILAAGRATWAAYVGLLAGALATVAGFQASSSLGDEDAIEYPYDSGARGLRLAIAALVTVVGIVAFALVPEAFEAAMGPTLFILAAGTAILGPAMVVMILVWVVDGLSLRFGVEHVGDPLVGATGSMALALVLALGGATAGLPATFVLLVAFGGLVPSLFVLWSLGRLDRELARPLA